MKYVLIGCLIFLGIMALSYGITVGLIYLICLCFSWKFNILIATGIWLAMFLLKDIFSNSSKS